MTAQSDRNLILSLTLPRSGWTGENLDETQSLADKIIKAMDIEVQLASNDSHISKTHFKHMIGTMYRNARFLLDVWAEENFKRSTPATLVQILKTRFINFRKAYRKSRSTKVFLEEESALDPVFSRFVRAGFREFLAHQQLTGKADLISLIKSYPEEFETYLNRMNGRLRSIAKTSKNYDLPHMVLDGLHEIYTSGLGLKPTRTIHCDKPETSPILSASRIFFEKLKKDFVSSYPDLGFLWSVEGDFLSNYYKNRYKS